MSKWFCRDCLKEWDDDKSEQDGIDGARHCFDTGHWVMFSPDHDIGMRNESNQT